jgi:hypothetical protein
MDRISDERMADMIDVGKTWAGSFAADLVSALVELRERRAADNYVPHPDCPCTKI